MSKNTPTRDILPPELAGIVIPDNSGRASAPLSRRRAAADEPAGFIGTSPVMLELYARIENAARSTAPVFITGEPGTGKTLCARTLHRRGRQARGPFVTADSTNADTLPALFAQSGGGTLFLADLTNFSIQAQRSLLRLIRDDGPARHGTRLICATAEDPRAAMRSGKLRADLFHRLHILPLFLPPLRARGDDVVDLAHVFLRRRTPGDAPAEGAEEKIMLRNFSPDAEYMLRTAPWPGNVRQLRSAMLALGLVRTPGDDPTVTPALLAPVLQNGDTGLPAVGAAGAIRSLAAVERETIETAIRLCSGNIPQAARSLGISPSTLYRKKAGWTAGPASRPGRRPPSE